MFETPCVVVFFKKKKKKRILYFKGKRMYILVLKDTFKIVAGDKLLYNKEFFIKNIYYILYYIIKNKKY